MLNSIEARTIFTDNSLVEFAQKIPFKLKCKNGNKKHILKKSFNKTLPKIILNRKKKGFGIPVNSILKKASYEVKNADPFLDWSIFILEKKKLI